MKCRFSTYILFIIVMSFSSFAQGDNGKKTYSKDFFIMPKGEFAINSHFILNMSTDRFASPFSLNPDIKFGLTDRIEISLNHSPYGITGLWNGFGGGLCLTGKTDGCADFYDGPIGLFGAYQFEEEDKELDYGIETGFVFNSFTNSEISLKVQFTARWHEDDVVVETKPNITFGLTQRDMGNKEFLSIPVWAGYNVSPKVNVGLQTGITGPMSDLGDFYTIPFSITGSYIINNKIQAGAAFSFLNLMGKNSNSDLRSLSLYLNWRK